LAVQVVQPRARFDTSGRQPDRSTSAALTVFSLGKGMAVHFGECQKSTN